MRFHDIDPRLHPLALPAGEVPHMTIEPNKTCNIRCAACYSLDRRVVKPYEQVIREIDEGLAQRNLETISLLGGEPTLHPRIADIVRAVKQRGLVCMLVTNGVTLLANDALLDGLIEAGVDRFVLHIDAGQEHVHGDVAAARHTLARRLESRRVWFAFALTVQAGNEDALTHVMREYARYRFFDGILSTLALDFEGLFAGGVSRYPAAELGRVHRSLTEDLGIRPASGIPTSVDPDEVGWLMYFYYLNTATGRTFSLSPAFNRGLRWVWRALTGRHFFAATMDPRGFLPCLLATALVELVIAPWRIVELWHLLRGSAWTRDLRFHYVVVQVPPHLDEEGRLHVCWQCPDAVMRNGRLIPVCLADQLDPLGHRPVRAPAEIVAQVREHLGQPADLPDPQQLRKTG